MSDSASKPDIGDVMDAFVDRWAPACERSKFVEELRAVARFEMQRCATAAGDATLEQDEAGHRAHSDTWHAACVYIQAKIRSVKPDWETTRADLIREDVVKAERKRCADAEFDNTKSLLELTVQLERDRYVKKLAALEALIVTAGSGVTPFADFAARAVGDCIAEINSGKG
jgi:hypothetical protein